MSRTLACLLIPLCASLACAQDRQDSFTGCHAIRGARILVEPGRALESATIVIRDGLIEALGPDLEPPADALVLDGTGLTVTSGFLVAGPAVAGPDPESAGQAPERETSRRGLTASRRAADALLRSPLDGDEWLKQGVTALLVSPEGQPVGGQAALVATAGPDAGGRILQPTVALVASFRSNRGSYPSSLMGVVAALRQFLLDAGRVADIEDLRTTDPTGIPRPAFDPELQAARDVVRGSLPVILVAGRAGDVERAGRLAAEFGIVPWVRGSLPVAERVGALAASHGVAILEPAWRKPRFEANKTLVKSTSGRTSSGGGRDPRGAGRGPRPGGSARRGPGGPGRATARNREAAAVEPPQEEAAEPDQAADEPAEQAPEDPWVRDRREHLEAEERKDLETLLRAGSALAEQGVPFLFGAEGPADLLTHVRGQVENGLTSDLALQALTLRPAMLLGLEESRGRVAAGLVADLAVFSGEPFGEGRLAHVFVAGSRFDLAPPRAADAASDDPEVAAALEKLAGRWQVPGRREGPPGNVSLTFADGRLEGSWESQMGTSDLVSASFAEGTYALAFEADRGGRTMTLEVTATLSEDGDTLEGELAFGDFGKRPFKATRTDGGER